jgi:hypothetical protein
MPSAQEYTDKIRALDAAGLRDLWSRIEAHDTPGWETGRAFEYLIVRGFEIEGFEVRFPFDVRWPGEETSIEQIDGTIYGRGLACLVESKSGEQQNVGPIAKMRNQLLRRPTSTIGAIFSKQGFTQPAHLLASFTMPQAILLWNGREIATCVAKSKFGELFFEKYKKAVEEGLPDYLAEEKMISWQAT